MGIYGSKNHLLVASIDIFGCNDIMGQIIRDNLHLQVGSPYHYPTTRYRLRELSRQMDVNSLEIAAIQYKDHPFLVFVTVDVVIQEEMLLLWRKSPISWKTIDPKLLHFLETARTCYPNDTSPSSRVLLQVMENIWLPCINTLTEDYRPVQRSLAALFLGWAPGEIEVINALLDALTDSDATVRNNAGLSLLRFCQNAQTRAIIANRAVSVVTLLHSPFTLDRNKAAAILLELIDLPSVRAAIDCRAVARLHQMANLHQPNNTLLARLILAHLGRYPFPIPLILLGAKTRQLVLRLQTHLWQSRQRSADRR
jgi:hypothetical protein